MLMGDGMPLLLTTLIAKIVKRWFGFNDPIIRSTSRGTNLCKFGEVLWLACCRRPSTTWEVQINFYRFRCFHWFANNAPDRITLPIWISLGTVAAVVFSHRFTLSAAGKTLNTRRFSHVFDTYTDGHVHHWICVENYANKLNWTNMLNYFANSANRTIWLIVVQSKLRIPQYIWLHSISKLKSQNQ